MGWSLNDMYLPSIPSDNGLGKQQQSRTDIQVRFVGSFLVHLKSNLAIFHAEANDAALPQEIVGFANREHGNITETGDKFVNSSTLIFPDKKQLAAFAFGKLPDMTDPDGPTCHQLALNCSFQVAVKRVVGNDAENDGVIFKSACRPFHKLREMEEERSLQAVFIDLRLSGCRHRKRQKERTQQEEGYEPGTCPSVAPPALEQ